MNTISPTRLNGMASGLDTDALVSAMMMSHQNRVDKLFYSKTLAEWKKEAYLDFNNQLRKFREENMSVLNGANNMLSPNSYKNYKIELAGGSITSGVTAGTAGTAVTGLHTVNKVESLARGFRFVTGGEDTATTFTADGKGLSSTNVRLGDTSLSSAFGDSDSMVIAINQKEFTINKSDSLSKVMSLINMSSAGVKLSYSQLSDKFTLESKNTGANSEAISITKGAELFEAMGMDLSQGIGGQNAVAYINGKRVESSVNEVALDGVRFTLSTTFDESQAVTFSVTSDNKSTVDKIKSFITKLNEIIKNMYDKYSEKKNYGYNPLTDEQKRELKEDEIKLWTEKAKSGIIRRDTGLSGFIESVRSAVYTDVGGLGSLASIGITTGSYKAGEAPQFKVDEAKLLAALNEDPDRVAAMFTNVSTSENYATKVKESGAFVRISLAMETFTNRVNQSTIKNLDRDLYQLTRRYEEQEKKLYILSENYYKKFAAMETALSKMQSQSNWLTMQFASMSGQQK